MKAGWHTKTLGDVLVKTETVNPAQLPENEFDYIDVSSVSNETFEIVETQRLKGQDAPSRARKLVKANDVIFATIRPTLKRIAIVPENLDNQVCSTGYFVLRPKPGIDHRFVFYSLFTASFQESMEALQKGASYPAVTDGDVRAQQIPLPPLTEQRRIVSILGEAFDGIVTAKANAEKNLRNAHAIFESCLRSVFSRGENGWRRETHLSSVLSEQPRNGWSPPLEFQTGAGVPVLTLSSVTGFEYDGARVKMSSVPTRSEAHYWLKSDELLITRSNTPELVGHVAIYDGNPVKAICCDLIMKMTVNPSKALTRFIYYYLRSPEARAHIMSRAHGASSTMKKIGKQVVQGIPVPLPPLSEQQSVVLMLDAYQQEAKRLESIYQRKLAALDELKQSLLHQAFSSAL